MDKKVPLYWTVIGGLIWTAILIVTFRQCSNPDAVAYIGFAGTITSLVLGVVAIFYSIVSNNQSSENIGVLKEASDKISQGAVKTVEVEEKLSNSINDLQQVYSEIKLKIDELPNHIKSVGDKWDGTDKFIREKLNAASNAENRSETFSNNFTIPDEKIDQFLSRSSFNGLEMIYAVCLSIEKDTSFNVDFKKLDEICRVNETNSIIGYFQGYFICLVAIGLLKGKLNGNIVEVTYVNQYFVGKIESAIATAINKQKEETQKRWTKNVEEIKAAFSKNV